MSLFQFDFFIYMLVVLLVVGGVFVVYSAVGKKPADADNEDELVSLAKKLNSLESSVSEADEAASLLNDVSKNVFKEFDVKYQELLFLYNLIDEKQKNLEGPALPVPKIDILVGDSKKSGFNPKFANVLDLNKKGKSVEEIARALDIGKGEVMLILNLGGRKHA